MFGLAKLAVRNPIYAAAIASALVFGTAIPIKMLNILGMPIATVMLVASASLCALTMLRFGANSGLFVFGSGFCLLAVVGLLTGAGLNLGVMALFFWIPSSVGAYVLRRTVRLDIALAALGSLAALAMLSVYLLYPDQTQIWGAQVKQAMEVFRQALEQSAAGDAQASATFSKRLAELDRLQQYMTSYMTSFTIVSLLLFATFALIQARYWQAKLFNPGGFQLEFHALRFGQTLAIAGLFVCVVAAVAQWAPAIGLAFIVICLFTFQGLAVVHAMVKKGRLGQGWLIGIYILLLVLGSPIVLVAALGLLDNWLDIAKRQTDTGQA